MIKTITIMIIIIVISAMMFHIGGTVKEVRLLNYISYINRFWCCDRLKKLKSDDIDYDIQFAVIDAQADILREILKFFEKGRKHNAGF